MGLATRTCDRQSGCAKMATTSATSARQAPSVQSVTSPSTKKFAMLSSRTWPWYDSHYFESLVTQITVSFFKMLNLDISCKNHAAGCDFSADLARVVTHEEDCPYRSVKCVVLNCYQDLKFNDIEEHMAVQHQDMMVGEWVNHKYKQNGSPIIRSSYHPCEYFIRTWRSSGMRLFATLLKSWDSYEKRELLWTIWVTAACGKRSAKKLRAEVRVSSNILPECSLVYYMPVTRLESDILVKGIMDFDKRDTILRLQNEILNKHIKDPATGLKEGMDVPFKCLVHKKVLLKLEKADMEEKVKEDADEAKEEKRASS